DGKFDVTDANILANKIIAGIQRAYAPFDVNVIAASATNINDIKNSLALRNTHDTYMLVAGDSPGIEWGFAPEDVGNSQDNLGVVYADRGLKGTAGASWDLRANAMARAIAHESGHAFGLHHTDPNTSIVAGDVMGALIKNSDWLGQNLFSRYAMPRQDGGTQ